MRATARFVVVSLLSSLPVSASAFAADAHNPNLFGGEASSDWLSRAERSLVEKEYEASANPEGLQAPNRRHNFRVYFEPDGVRLVERTAEGSPELLRLRVAEIGRGELRRAIGAGTVAGSGKRVELARPGQAEGLEERFENSPEGLRHSLTISSRPPGAGDLEIVFEVEIAAVERAEEGVLLLAPNGRRLAMKRLPVTDAAGRLLPSWLEAAGSSRVRFTVGDGDALYPLVVEFLFTGGAAATLEGNQADSQFGVSVAGAGDVNGDGYADVLVGASDYDSGQADEGAAFVFLGSAAGIASGGPANAATTLQSNQAGAEFGRSVAGAGDVNGDGYADVLVGAYLYDSGQDNEGAAFVFLGSNAGVASGGPANAAATLQGNQVLALFGRSVAGAGDVDGDGYADVVVGAYGYDSGQTGEGAAFVFLGGAAGIASAGPAGAATTLQGNQDDAFLGFSVAGAGDVDGDGYDDVLVGAFGYDAGQAAEGAAFVFLGSSSGIANGNPGTAAATLQGNQIAAEFGGSVAGAGDVNGDGYADVVVGAHLYDLDAADEGAAFVFLGSPSGIASGNPATAAATLEASGTGTDVGRSVAGAGDVNGDGYADVLVGAEVIGPSGAAWVFLGSASGIASSSLVPAGFGGIGGNRGISVSGAGDVDGDGYADVLVGANLNDSGQDDEGAAFVFLGSAAGIASGGAASAATTLQGNQFDARFGLSVAGAGDVNGDGYADVLVGAYGYDFGESGEGAAFVFLGSPAGIVGGGPAGAATTLAGGQQTAFFGVSVAGAGDVNGDGYADILVGAELYGAGGAAFVFLGSPSGIANGGPASAAATLQVDQSFARFGNSVAGAGDVNGDGYADVLVGARAYDSGEADEGAGFVFLGSASGIASGGPANAATILQGNQADSEFGFRVAGAGDVNGDGYADVLVGAYRYDSGQDNEGAAFVFLGSATGITSDGPAGAATTLQGNQANAAFGRSVAGAGDVNGDGYADVLAGAYVYDSGQDNEGAAFVFLGGGAGVASGGPASAATILQGNQVDGFFGASVAGAGDLNGDGYADVVVGAYGYDAGETTEGAAFVFLGSAAGIPSAGPAGAATTLQGNQDSAFFGIGVTGAGDVNGDGYADLLIGADDYDAGLDTDVGAAFVFLGNAGAGRPVLARQFRTGSPTPVQPWGGSLALDSFDTRMFCTHPAGGGRVKLQVEACPAGVDFQAAGCVTAVSPEWSEVSATSGLTLSLPIDGLTASRLYHWRARTLYAPASVTETGITPPPRPAHGPWRRHSGQAIEADIRTLGGVFYSLAPCRVVDTRLGSGAPIEGPILTSGIERALPLVNKCGVPTTAVALSANLTAVDATGPGFLVLYPLAGPPPPTSNLSFNAGANRANNSMLWLNRLGQVQVRATVDNPAGADQVHLVLDVNGYFE